MSYATHTAEVLRRPAAHVDKILKGAKPGERPVERSMTFELILDLKTATEHGLTIPPSTLCQADEVIR
ncbi:MAG TPA: ABC transporter substrate binding protein [Candidatus Tectomicrobia bacterium]|nr:ABC transporter substrate binding protein [Candidatus Tectomicrobia bacterium]